VALGSALATSGRFGEVFSKLRAVTVVPAAGLEAGAERAPWLAPFCGAGRLFFGTRWAINQFETRLVLDTLRDGPEIHLGADFLGSLLAGLTDLPGRASVLGTEGARADHSTTLRHFCSVTLDAR
jgi:hypothetical protein